MRAVLFASVIIMTLVGCGGGGSSSGGNSGSSSGGNSGSSSGGNSGGENNSAASDSAPSQTSPASVAGVTADGYLVGANVCLDTDADNSCSGEATITTSAEGGAFEISDATEADFAQYPLLTEIVEDVTTDADRITDDNSTGVIGTGEGFVLASPPGLLDGEGKAFISPITSLVENQRLRAIANGQSSSEALASAKAEILASIGDVDLTADYIAASASGDETAKAAAERVHVIARAVTGLLADAKQEVATAIDSGDLTAGDTAAVFSVAINQIVKQVSVVVSDVETALASINSRGLSNAERAAAITDRIKQLVIDNDVVDAATLPALVEVDRVERTALTASEMLFVDGGVWIGEVDVEESEGIETGENGETSIGVIEDVFVGFNNLRIIENGESSTSFIENGETSTSFIENGETSTNVIENGETSTNVIENGETSTSVIENGETSTSVIENVETSTVTIDDSYDLSPFGLFLKSIDEGVGLTDNGWQQFTDQVTLVTNSDGSVSCDNTVVTCEISNVRVIDLGDLDIASVMENYSQDGALWRKVLKPGFSFTEGSKGYSAEIASGDEYTINFEASLFSISDGTSEIVYDGPRLSIGDDLRGNPALTFAGLTKAACFSDLFCFDSDNGVVLMLREDGTADYYFFGASAIVESIITVEYTLETINEVEIFRVPRVDLPTGLSYFDNINEGDLVLSIFEDQAVLVNVEEAKAATALFLDTATNDELIDAIDFDKLCCVD